MNPEALTSAERIPHAFELAHELESIEDDVVLKEKLGILLDSIEVDLGVKLVSGVNELYKGMQSENCLVRVESLSRVLETVETGSTMKISDETETHYAFRIREVSRLLLRKGRHRGLFAWPWDLERQLSDLSPITFQWKR